VVGIGGLEPVSHRLEVRAGQLLDERTQIGLESARFTVELQTRRDVLSFSRGEKVAGTAG